jgi:Protein of unknown function (DUF3828)
MIEETHATTALSRRCILTGFAIALAALPVLPALASGGSGAKAFLSDIYRRYVGSSVQGISLDSVKTVRSYFTFGLASLIIEDRAANRGERPVLDGDPFIGSHDWDISNLAIGVKDTGPLKAIGTVTFMNSGKAEQVVLELLRSGNDWRIADVAWESGTLRALYRRHAASPFRASMVRRGCRPCARGWRSTPDWRDRQH